jgi:1-deoxypentalenic acid 11beta-hydroxylase
MATSRFMPANDLLGQYEVLRRQYEQDGFLFFENVLDTDLVDRTRRELCGVLAEQGVVHKGASAPLATGVGIDAVDQQELYSLPLYVELTNCIELQRLLDIVFDEAVSIYHSTNIRYALPMDELYASPPHQDHFFVGPNDDFRTVWIPLMEIDDSVGGLAVARGSHLGGLRDHVETENVSYILKGRKQKGVPIDIIEEEWVTADYKPGDVLIFHCHTLHRGLPNSSDKVRLSLDVRCQPSRRPLNFQARTTMLEQAQYRADVKAIATTLGLDEPAFEIVVNYMLRNGQPVDRATVERVAATST